MAQIIKVGNFYFAQLGNYHIALTKSDYIFKYRTR